MSFKRKFARQWRVMKSPVFEALAWVLALFVPHRADFRKFRDRGEADYQNELLLLSKAIDIPQDLPRAESKSTPNVERQDGQALASLISGGIWAIESIEQTPEVTLDSWQCFELKLPPLFYRTRHLAGSNARNKKMLTRH